MKYSRIGIKSVFIFLKKFVFQIFLSRLILVGIIVEKVKNISSVKGKILLTYKKAKIKKKKCYTKLKNVVYFARMFNHLLLPCTKIILTYL